jgi:tetratricopeptide (TPR) repeat protein
MFLLFCNVKQAKIQRLYELDLYKHYLTDCLDHCDDLGRVRLSLRYYTYLGQIHPEMVRAEEMRGLCFLLLGENQQADRAFAKVLAKRPRFYWVEFDQAMALYHLHQWDKAAALFKDLSMRSNQDMLYAGILPSIGLIPEKMRDPLVKSLEEFIMNLRVADEQMLMHCAARDHAVPQNFLLMHPWTIFNPSAMQAFID